MLGSIATKAKAAVDLLRDAGQAVGLLRTFLFRPFPAEAFRTALTGKRGVAVIDQNLAPGSGGVLHNELAAKLYDGIGELPVLVSFIGGLGGRDIGPEEFCEMARVTLKAAEEKQSPPPRLLYTEKEWRAMKKLQAIALHQDSEDRA